MSKLCCVYILSNASRSSLYVGVTSNLEARVQEHKLKTKQGFTHKYNLNRLVYFECGDDIAAAIAREKQLKGWTRKKKEFLIKKVNPAMADLSARWY